MPNQRESPVAPGGRVAALVACIGNELVADDAIGYEVYERLRRMELPRETRVEFVGVGGLALLDLLRGDERLLVTVDAVQLGAAAGTIHSLSWDELPSAAACAVSVHGIGLREAVEIGRVLYPELIPPVIRLVGVEGRCFDRMREAMTPATAAAADGAAEAVRQLITMHEVQ
ncbi:MAG: hydrogenase maturation protease [Syntrophales bacterium]